LILKKIAILGQPPKRENQIFKSLKRLQLTRSVIMLSFIGRNIIQKIITLFFVSVISFLIIHLAPGKPTQVDPMNPKFTPELVEKFKKEFHLDKPLYEQYLIFYKDLLTGETVSWKDNQPVLEKIWERFLNSLPLFIVGTLLTWTLSFPVGIRSAIHRGGYMTGPPRFSLIC